MSRYLDPDSNCIKNCYLISEDNFFSILSDCLTSVEKNYREKKYTDNDIKQLSFDGLGPYIENQANKYLFDILLKDLGSSAPDFFTKSVTSLNISIRVGIKFYEQLQKYSINPNCANAKDFKNIFNIKNSIHISDLAIELIQTDKWSTFDVLKKNFDEHEYLISLAHGIYWFNLVSEKYRSTKVLDTNLLGQAMSAVQDSRATWTMDMIDKEYSEKYSKNAKKAHQEHYEMKEQAIQYWRENIDRKLSNDKAALILSRVVNLTPRVLSRYVSEAKKENIPSAS